MRHMIAILLVLFMFACLSQILVAGPKIWLEPEEKKSLYEIIGKMESKSKIEEEKEMVKELKTLVDGLVFLKAGGSYNRKALENLERNKSYKLIVLGLKSEFIETRIKVVKTLSNFNYSVDLGLILKALKKVNAKYPIGSSSEEANAYILYQKGLIALISQITELKFEVTDYKDFNQIKKVIDLSEKWLSEQKEKDTSEDKQSKSVIEPDNSIVEIEKPEPFKEDNGITQRQSLKTEGIPIYFWLSIAFALVGLISLAVSIGKKR